jgi:exopolysaccharide biosynthesis polyprenyl glycosylphosphotransferase
MFAGEFRKQKALFAIADALAFVFAGALALILHDPSGAMRASAERADPQTLAEGVAIAALLWFGVFRAFDLYQMRNGSRKEAIAIIKACTVAATLMLLAAFAAHLEASRIFVGIFYLLSVPTVVVTRMLLRSIILHFYSSPGIATPLVIIGFNPLAHFLCDRIEEELTHYEIIGFIASGSLGREHCGYPVLGPPDQMRALQRAHPCLEAVVAIPDASLEEQAKMVDLCESEGVQWWAVPWVYRSAPTGFKVDSLGMIPLVGCRRSNIEGLNYMVKRSFDIICASIAVIFVLPVLALAALAILMFDGSPILFRQQRIGAYGRRFEMLKFRTMTNRAADMVHRDFVQQWICEGDTADQNGHQPNGTDQRVFKLSNDPRISKVGRILRRFSIDELPQLWNVIRGDMSLIGPRPALPYELELYKDWHRRRLEGMPGITGLWQVSGRNQVSFDAMVRMDLAYLRDWSLTSDIRILLQTIPVLLRGNGL